MSVAVASLKWDSAKHAPQDIVYDEDKYHLVRFPYSDSYDPWGMHDPENGGTSQFPDPLSGLIWPSHAGWGVLSAMVFWKTDAQNLEYRARFVRDPLSMTPKKYDSTGTTDSAVTRGGQYRTYMWQIFVEPGMPLGLKISVREADDGVRKTPITLAEFKLAIHTNVLVPGVADLGGA